MDVTTDRASTGGLRFDPPADPDGPAVSFEDRWEMPSSARPNDATISLYEDRRREWRRAITNAGDAFVIPPAGNAQRFARTANPESTALQGQLQEGYLLSYLYYDNGVIRYDGMAADGRFRRDLDSNTLFFTHSTGKNITSYIVGHAICEGYISSIDEQIDWPMVQDTLYQGQSLRNLLNMSAGDRHVMNEDGNRVMGSPIHHRQMGMDTAAFLLRGTERRGNRFFYNNFLTDLIAGYTAYRAGSNYPNLVRSVFRNKVRIEDEVTMFLHVRTPTNGERSPYYGQLQSRVSYSYLMTRMDFLRLGVAMMRDYQSNNCVGQYLRQLQAQSVPCGVCTKLRNISPWMWSSASARRYGGQFYFDYAGMSGRNIMGTDGQHGQNLLIDLDNSRIVATHAAATGWDVRSLIVDVIAQGRLPD
jgi:CubicO group peptidase (beta-lactamase class C family)